MSEIYYLASAIKEVLNFSKSFRNVSYLRKSMVAISKYIESNLVGHKVKLIKFRFGANQNVTCERPLPCCQAEDVISNYSDDNQPPFNEAMVA